MKFLKFLSQNLLFILVLLLLVIIPLYPKIPIIGINHTWVYIRAEDFIVASSFAVLGTYLLLKKATLRTPLTLPIFLFWGVGLISTIYAVLFIFPTLTGVFPHLAFFNYARRIEYIGLFFLAYNAIKSKKQIPFVVWALVGTLFAVVLYGFGQKFLGFPAFLTGNEEFAKGIPLRLSSSARIPSTFAGHYDLAAWLVIMIPIMGSMIFAVKNWLLKFLFVFAGFWGLILLLLTASRVSYMVYLVTIVFLLILQKQKKFIIPVVILSLWLLSSFQGISQRFTSTISQVDLIVDARTGKAVGIAKSGEGPLVIEDKQSTGENLPQGTGYINIPGSDSTNSGSDKVTIKRTKIAAGKESTEITTVEGDFVIKKALAYDVSFTTRFQGTWPRAISAFKRNILLGSGYSSISLASDNNYLRILGEVGILGLVSFALIFVFYGIYVAKNIKEVESRIGKAFVLGVSASILGVALNAVLIDVFEASKVAFVFWPLMGLSVGLLHLTQKDKLNYKKEILRVFTSIWAIFIYLLTASFLIFSRILPNYFVGDDFTWLRWIADCKKVLYTDGVAKCVPFKNTFIEFFTNSDGFFYRPGTKIYFYFMYSIFWLTSSFYHVVSILLHFGVVVFVFLVTEKILKNKFFALISSVLFLVLAVHFETIFWVSSTGHIIASLAAMVSLYLYMLWRDKKNYLLLVVSIVSAFVGMLFHEFGIITPLLICAYELILRSPEFSIKKLSKHWSSWIYTLLIPIYLIMRVSANSHWMQGDYSYNIVKLPLNFVGNIVGYIGITILGSRFLPFQTALREIGKTNLGVAFIIVSLLAIVALFIYYALRKANKETKQVVVFSFVFFIVALSPFLGLGNIAIRYAYLPSFALVLLFTALLQILYVRLKKLNRIGALVMVLAMVTAISVWNISELNRVNKDWKRAGDITQNLLVGFNDYFPRAKATPQNPVFYFVDVPIRTGEAWIFPVGLDDALWFTFQNENLTVKTSNNLELALDEAEGSQSARVFQFGKDGTVEEVTRTMPVIEAPIHGK